MEKHGNIQLMLDHVKCFLYESICRFPSKSGFTLHQRKGEDFRQVEVRKNWAFSEMNVFIVQEDDDPITSHRRIDIEYLILLLSSLLNGDYRFW